MTGNSSKKSPELLAAYCHKILKKSNKNLEEAELEETLNKMLIVFKYISDKDVFEVYYKKRLADRLIEQTSASDDAEASMISKMKHTCGYNYTNKLQRMYQVMNYNYLIVFFLWLTVIFFHWFPGHRSIERY